MGTTYVAEIQTKPLPTWILGVLSETNSDSLQKLLDCMRIDKTDYSTPAFGVGIREDLSEDFRRAGFLLANPDKFLPYEECLPQS